MGRHHPPPFPACGSSEPWEWRLRARVQSAVCHVLRAAGAGPGVRSWPFQRQRHAGHVTHTLSAFPGDSPAKRFPSGFLHRGRWAECSEVLCSLPHSESGDNPRGGHALWERACSSGLRTVLAPEQLPWDAPSRRPSWTSFSFAPGEAELGASLGPQEYPCSSLSVLYPL